MHTAFGPVNMFVYLFKKEKKGEERREKGKRRKGRRKEKRRNPM